MQTKATIFLIRVDLPVVQESERVKHALWALKSKTLYMRQQKILRKFKFDVT